MRRTLLAVGLAASLAIALALALLYRGISPEFAIAPLENQLGHLLGKPVALSRAPHLQIRQQLRLEIQGLQVAGDAGQPPMLVLDELTVVLRSRSLLAGPVVIETLRVAGLDVDSRIDENGISNLPQLGNQDQDEERERDAPALRLVNVELIDLHLRHRDARSDRDLRLDIARLEKPGRDPQQLSTTAEGTLQGAPWRLTATARSSAAIINARDISAELDFQLASLQLTGALRFSDLATLADGELDATLSGSLPPAIAALSPLIDADSPIQLQAAVRDVDPGLAIDVDLELARLSLTVDGQLDRPREGDVADLQIALRAPSLAPLASALGLGETEDVPLTLQAELNRRGTALNVPAFTLDAGAHRSRGSAQLPDLFTGRDATIELVTEGPDFRFIQRLLRRPPRLDNAYALRMTLASRPTGPELLDSSLHIGEHRASVTGPLGAFPDFAGSGLNVTLSGPSLRQLAEAFDLRLGPNAAVPYHASGAVSVDADGLFSVDDIAVDAGILTAEASGSMRGSPHYDQIDLRLALQSPSLAVTSSALGAKALGAIPAELRAEIGGSLDDLSLRPLALEAGGLTITRSAGSLNYRAGSWESDLSLAVQLRELPTLLGEYAPEGLTDLPLQMTIEPRRAADLLNLQVTNLEGPGFIGSGGLRMASDLSLDTRLRANLNLAIREPPAVLKKLPYYQPPDAGLELQVRTQRKERAIEVISALQHADRELLSLAVEIPDEGDAGARLTGKGSDIHQLGHIDGIPAGPLPYAVTAAVTRVEQRLDVSVETLTLGASEARADLQLWPEDRRIAGRIDVQQLDLPAWLDVNNKAGSDNVAGNASGPTRTDRLIPELPLPVALLDSWQVDMSLDSGPLGLPDPVYPAESLVDRLSLRLETGSGEARLQLDQIKGSRGELQGVLKATRMDDALRADLSLAARDLPLSLTSSGITLNQLPKHAVTATLTARGATTRRLAETLTGELLVIGDGGTVRPSVGRFATNSFTDQFLDALLPTRQRAENVEVECTVIGILAQEGNLTLDPGFVMRTRQVDISARGEIDLVSERLRVRFDNQARRGLGISAAGLVNPYLQITGTLARPLLGVDLAGSAIAGGAAVATGGLSVLAKPLYGRFLNRSNPCEVARDRWEKRNTLSGTGKD